MRTISAACGLLFAGCIRSTPVLSDVEMERAAWDIRQSAISYLDAYRIPFTGVTVDVGSDMGIRVKVRTKTAEDRAVGRGLARWLDAQFNHRAYLYRPRGYAYRIEVALARS